MAVKVEGGAVEEKEGGAPAEEKLGVGGGGKVEEACCPPPPILPPGNPELGALPPDKNGVGAREEEEEVKAEGTPVEG